MGEKEKSKIEEAYDIVIVGAGTTGMSSAMYSARLGMKTLCLGASSGSETAIGGVITTTKSIENYPGFKSIGGTELAKRIEEHAKSYPLVTIREERVIEIEKKEKEFLIKTEKKKYSAKAVIFAGGAKWRKLEIPGGKEFENKGVAYCALCDAPLYKNKIAAVIGGSDSAVKDALILVEYAKKLYIIYRGEKVRAEKANIDKLMENPKVEIICRTNVIEIRGDKKVKSVALDREFNGKKEIEVDGVFVAIGHIPNSELAKSLGVKLNEKGEIAINHQTAETNVSGVFAAGDITDKKVKQAIIGVAEGCMAAYSAFEFIGKSG